MPPETNQSQHYVVQLADHFKDGAPLAYQVLATKGQAFPRKAAYQPVLGRLGECYVNAYYLAMNQGLHYTEGMAIHGKVGFPMDHAWCVDDAGQVYDPTWDNGQDYFGVAFDHGGLANIYDQTGHHSVFGNLHRLSTLGVDGVRQMLLNAVLPLHIDQEAARD